MSRKLYACLAVFGLVLSTGCSMCQRPFDYTYSAFGGSWQRGDQVNGRVGSTFDPAGATVSGASWEEITTEPAGTPIQTLNGGGKSVLIQPDAESSTSETGGAGTPAPLLDDSASVRGPVLLPADSSDAAIYEAGF